MKKLTARLKKANNKKGFTLIEIIVVMVIIAIMAAAGIPAMMNYIGQARSRALLAEARAVYIAVQAAYTEAVMTGGTADLQSTTTDGQRHFATTTTAHTLLQGYLDVDIPGTRQYLFVGHVLVKLTYERDGFFVLYERRNTAATPLLDPSAPMTVRSGEGNPNADSDWDTITIT